MKVALIGNMNNNFFSLLRYLRDRGLDAYLYLGLGLPGHFQPDQDTVNFKKWSPFIRNFQIKLTIQNMYKRSQENAKILKALRDEYDIIITESYYPALFKAYGFSIDIFIPFDDAIEGTKPIMLCRYSPKFSLIRFLIRRLQIPAIKGAVTIVNGISGYTLSALTRLSLNVKFLCLPMVYTAELLDKRELNQIQKSAVVTMQRHSFVVFCHSRHHWKTVEWNEKNINDSKKIELLLFGFALFVKRGVVKNPLLVLFEYGADVEASKTLIKELGIEKFVYWLPLMSRKDILPLISYCHIGVGEFGTDFWGGVGWEILVSGKLLINKYSSSSADFYNKLGFPPPNIIAASSAEDIELALEKANQNRDWIEQMGRENAIWYDYNIVNNVVSKICACCEEIYLKKQQH